MKIKSLYTADRHEEGSELTIKDELGKETPLVLVVKGLDSPTYRAAFKKNRQRFYEDTQAHPDKDIDSEDYALDTLCEVVCDWKGTDEPFDPELLRELLIKAPYVKNQIDAHVSNRKAFTKGKSTK